MEKFQTGQASGRDSLLRHHHGSSHLPSSYQSDSTEAGPVPNWRECFPEIIAQSPSMLKVLETVYKVAQSSSAVLILGESGCGKELIASAIHRLSKRAAQQFIPINCSAIPENLLESELFGHEKGAFTGADKKRTGRFEAATGGTIFLDEIGDMPTRLQAKLLRVLQEKKFTPLGGNELKPCDVRILTATNVDLEQAVQQGEFRLDLYYRLNVVPINLPPLRERKIDIPILLQHFLDIANRVHRLEHPCYLSDQVIHVLCNYTWPGNIRELQNLIERLVIIKGEGRIETHDLPENVMGNFSGNFRGNTANPYQTSEKIHSSLKEQTHSYINPTTNSSPDTQDLQRLPKEGLDLNQFIESLENSYILQALEQTGNNKNQAAKLLGINRTTLVERIKKRRLQTPP